MEKLQPFLYRKSARQRIILYLITRGYSFNQLSKMTARELKEIAISDDDLIESRNQVLSTLRDGHLVFTYPSGRKMGESDFFRILNQACVKVLGKSITVEEFVGYIHTAS